MDRQEDPLVFPLWIH